MISLPIFPQAKMMLDLIRPARYNPKFSAYCYLHGMHNFVKTPLAPAGTKVVIHMKSAQQASWDYQDRLDRYIGSLPDHYRCFKCFIPSADQEVITGTLTPNMTIEHTIQKAFDKIVGILQTKNVTNSIYQEPKTNINSAFKRSPLYLTIIQRCLRRIHHLRLKKWMW